MTNIREAGPRFGVSLPPSTNFAHTREVAIAADEAGLDLIGVQDHPYAPGFLDTFVVVGDLLSATRRIRVFPDVANLPLRPPAMLAKTAAALDVVSGGRFELALGAGGYWDAITRMGVPRRTPREANAALAEAIAVLRALWRGDGEPVHLDGEFYSLDGVASGPAPAHPIEIWTGAQGPRALDLTGAVADGWAAPIASHLPYEQWAGANRRIDEAARRAGRAPGDLRRVAQLVGAITPHDGDPRVERGAEPVRGTPAEWAGIIATLAIEQPFTSFVFWPEDPTIQQVDAYAREVVPLVHDLLARPASSTRSAVDC